MAEQRLRSKSDQKKAEKLKMQLYGKDKPSHSSSHPSTRSVTSRSDSSYTFTSNLSSVTVEKLPERGLSSDLTRILIYSSIAIGFQLALFLAENHGLVRF